METVKIDLGKLLNSAAVDNISGRAFGQKHAEDMHLIDHIEKNDKIVIVIDPTKVKAINDSFIKGFFSGVFIRLRKKEKVYKYFTFETSDFYKRLFDKNLTFLEAINND
jgi:hypothetical protein